MLAPNGGKVSESSTRVNGGPYIKDAYAIAVDADGEFRSLPFPGSAQAVDGGGEGTAMDSINGLR